MELHLHSWICFRSVFHGKLMLGQIGSIAYILTFLGILNIILERENKFDICKRNENIQRNFWWNISHHGFQLNLFRSYGNKIIVIYSTRNANCQTGLMKNFSSCIIFFILLWILLSTWIQFIRISFQREYRFILS